MVPNPGEPVKIRLRTEKSPDCHAWLLIKDRPDPIPMEPIRIRMSTIDDVKHFVTQANAQVSDIDVVSGRYLVDAKSVLGVCSLQKSLPIQLEIYSDDCLPLLNDLKPMLC